MATSSTTRRRERLSNVALAVLAVLFILASLWCFAYIHTSKGANFGCWPEPFPPLPAQVQYHYEVYCGA